MARRVADLDDTGGVILRRDAISMGMDDRAIRRLVRSGTWHRVRHGAYVDRAIWDSMVAEDQHRVLARAVLRTAGGPAVLSHLTAALEHGAEAWDVDLSNVHFTRLDRRAGRREAGVVQHRGRLSEDEFGLVHGAPVVSAARSLIEVTTVTDVAHGLVIANSLVHQRPEVLSAARSLESGMNHWKDTLATRIVLALADPRVESVAESRTAHLLWSQGIPGFEPQVTVRDGQGHVVGRVDFANPSAGAFLEVDGRVKYRARPGGKSLDQVLYEERQREKLICRLTGWICIRISWADLANPERLAREIRAAVAARRTPVN
jgi:hypothetical protein